MPAAAAAAVTSGSFAAPSSIEYSVCTCRWTNESDGLLTGGGTPQSSCVPDGRELPRATGGEDTVRWVDPRIAEGVLRGSDRTCLVTPDGSVTPASGQSPAHRDVSDPRLLVLLADSGVAGPLVEAAGGSLGVQLDLGHAAQYRLAVQFGQDGGAVPASPDRRVRGHPADRRRRPRHEQPPGGDHLPRAVPAQHVHGPVVGVVLFDLRRNALLHDEDPRAQGRDLGPVPRAGHPGGRRGHASDRPAGSTRDGTRRNRRSMAACSRTGSSSDPVWR